MSNKQPHGRSIEGVIREYTEATLPTAAALYAAGGRPGTRYVTSDDGVEHVLVLVAGVPALISEGGGGLVPGPATSGSSSGAYTVSGFSGLNLVTAAGQGGVVTVQPGAGVPAAGATPGVAPGNVVVRGGTGGAAGAGTGAGSLGSSALLTGGPGGAGSATGLPGGGGNVTITAGPAGANGGAAGAVGGGNATIDGGLGSGGGVNGGVFVGTGATTSLVQIAKANTNTLIGGPIAVTSTGAAPNANAAIDVVSTTQGVLFPRMSTAQKTAINGPSGLVVFDSTLNKLCVRGATAWETIMST